MTTWPHFFWPTLKPPIKIVWFYVGEKIEILPHTFKDIILSIFRNSIFRKYQIFLWKFTLSKNSSSFPFFVKWPHELKFLVAHLKITHKNTVVLIWGKNWNFTPYFLFLEIFIFRNYQIFLGKFTLSKNSSSFPFLVKCPHELNFFVALLKITHNGRF